MKIIFLDIDGVLHPALTGEDFCNVNHLLYIINKTGARIVISSDWKYQIKSLITKWEETLLPPYIDTTEKSIFSGKQLEREEEILNYLDGLEQSGIKLDNWVAIDDMPLKLNNFVKTNSAIGLTRKKAEEAIDLLTN